MAIEQGKTMVNAEKAKALAAALAQIEKQFGKGSIMRLGEGEVAEDQIPLEKLHFFQGRHPPPRRLPASL